MKITKPSFILEKLDEFEGQASVEVCSFENPFAVFFKFTWGWVVDPEVDFHVLGFGDLDSHAGDVGDFFFGWDCVWKEQVFPDSVGLASLKPENEGASLQIMLILPNWLDTVLEKVNVGAFFQFAGALEVLIERPKVFDCIDLSDWEKTVLEITFSLNEVLVPELERSMKF